MARDGSDSDYMFENGFTSEHGGLLHDSYYDENDYNEEEPQWFPNAQ